MVQIKWLVHVELPVTESVISDFSDLKIDRILSYVHSHIIIKLCGLFIPKSVLSIESNVVEEDGNTGTKVE